MSRGSPSAIPGRVAFSQERPDHAAQERGVEEHRKGQDQRRHDPGSCPGAARPPAPLDEHQQAVQDEVEQRQAVPRADGQADRRLVGEPGGHEAREQGGVSSEALGQGSIDGDGGHLREREVPALAPELGQAARAQRVAEQRPRARTGAAPQAGQHAEDAEVQHQAEARQQEQRRQHVRPGEHRASRQRQRQARRPVDQAAHDHGPAGRPSRPEAGEDARTHARPERRERQQPRQRQAHAAGGPFRDHDGLHPREEHRDDREHADDRRAIERQQVNGGYPPDGDRPAQPPSGPDAHGRRLTTKAPP